MPYHGKVFDEGTHSLPRLLSQACNDAVRIAPSGCDADNRKPRSITDSDYL